MAQSGSGFQKRINIPMVTGLYRARRMKRLLLRPAEVCIETTNRCNMECIICPHKDLNRPRGVMDFKLFQKIVDECVRLGVECIKPHNYGEPLLTPSFEKYVAYIRKRSAKIKILLVTNGTLLSDEVSDMLIRERVDEVNISIDGAWGPTYERIRRGGDFNRVVSNTRAMIEKKRQAGSPVPKVTVGMVQMNQSEEEIREFRDMWRGCADRVVLNKYSTRAGTLEGKEASEEISRVPCFRLWKQLVVCSDGRASLCCADWDCKTVIGDLNLESIDAIWRRDSLTQLRKFHNDGESAKIGICSNCNPAVWDPMPIWWY